MPLGNREKAIERKRNTFVKDYENICRQAYTCAAHKHVCEYTLSLARQTAVKAATGEASPAVATGNTRDTVVRIVAAVI